MAKNLMRTIPIFSLFALSLIILISVTGCKKENKDDPPKVWPATVTDIDGNVYKTCRIGDQLWMAENLRVSHFRNGDPVPAGDTDLILTGVLKPVYQWITKYDTSLLKDLGRVYTWYAANHSKKLCPTGWRIPDTTDVYILENYLGGKQIAGDKLKAADYQYWEYHQFSHPTNETGFTAYGGGCRGDNPGWGDWKQFAFFITSFNKSGIETMALNASTGYFGRYPFPGGAVHVRCIME
jgi:uncharacterized protein (TIGR02145 family)